MRLALIADTFPPLRTSGAVQLRDLAREFVRQGHTLTVILPAAGQREAWRLEEFDGARVLRLKAPRTKDIGYLRRTVGESLMPFAMLRSLRNSPFATEKWEGVIWYAPSIFHGPLASALKRGSVCRSYLILRDIFPQWAADMGMMGRGLPYHFFNIVARYQYSVADTIGVQAPGNLSYFASWKTKPGRKLEVLQNWLGRAAHHRCSIRVDETQLAGRQILVYAGNIGVAQGMDILLDLAERLVWREDIGFLFVGRGSDARRLAAQARTRALDNVLFFDEIDPDEIPDLYAQCDIGLVALDHRHKSHNIPGKFLTYMQSGLPVLANINAGNDLGSLIRDERVGQVCESNQLEDLERSATQLLEELADDCASIRMRCAKLFERVFSPEQAVRQIVAALEPSPGLGSCTAATHGEALVS